MGNCSERLMIVNLCAMVLPLFSMHLETSQYLWENRDQEICNGVAYHFRPLLGRGHTGHRLFSYAYSEGPCQIFEEFDTGPPTVLKAIWTWSWEILMHKNTHFPGSVFLKISTGSLCGLTCDFDYWIKYPITFLQANFSRDFFPGNSPIGIFQLE